MCVCITAAQEVLGAPWLNRGFKSLFGGGLSNTVVLPGPDCGFASFAQ